MVPPGKITRSELQNNLDTRYPASSKDSSLYHGQPDLRIKPASMTSKRCFLFSVAQSLILVRG
jgi:hypothetical protein